MRCGIAFGSNLGERLAHLRAGRAAVERLHEGGEPPLASPLYETEPVDCEPGSPPYLNAVMEIEWTGTPDALLAALQRIESGLGRPLPRPPLRNAPRTLDLDLLYAGELILERDALALPHPRIAARRFVLEPLADIRPDLLLPGQRESVAALLAKLPTTPAVRRIAEERDWR